MLDGKALGEQVVAVVRDFLNRGIAGIKAQLDSLEQRVNAIPAGAPGERGERGEPGEKGLDGAPGRDGIAGKDGAAGVQGDQGPKGEVGERGAPGESIKGDPGERGEKGEPGDPGPAGRDGVDGKDASVGKSAFEMARVRGFEGDEAEWLRSLAGPAGKDGAPGERGADGVTGKQGEPGAPGDRGEKGVDGRDGREGKDGRDGQNGRDAAEIAPLAAIDAEKSYPAGTWAKHAGGLWLARARTEGMTGWDCIVNGVVGIDVTPIGDDLRSFIVTVRCSDGQEIGRSFAMPTMIYRAVWRAGEYEPGDVVTWGGSAWHCQEKTTDEPGNGSTSWKLMVKRGRDGKDAAGREPKAGGTVHLR